jgi:hypothetical protein
MAAPGGGGSGENFDFCEYVYNPLMQQYQAMMRLMQMLRDSQNADCNDVQCFTDPNDPSSAANSLSRAGGSGGFLVTYGPMLIVWAVLMLGMFLLRPSSMRGGGGGSSQRAEKAKLGHDHIHGIRSRFPPNNDDDDDSTIS